MQVKNSRINCFQRCIGKVKFIELNTMLRDYRSWNLRPDSNQQLRNGVTSRDKQKNHDSLWVNN